MNYRKIALDLANGETIMRKDLPEDTELLIMHLKNVSGNCKRVIKQLEALTDESNRTD